MLAMLLLFFNLAFEILISRVLYVSDSWDSQKQFIFYPQGSLHLMRETGLMQKDSFVDQ